MRSDEQKTSIWGKDKALREGILNNIHRKDVGKDRNFWAEQQIRNIKSW